MLTRSWKDYDYDGKLAIGEDSKAEDSEVTQQLKEEISINK